MQLSFDNPVYLWYFASIPLLIITHFISLKTAKHKAMRFANFRTLKRIAGDRLLTKNTNVLILRVIILSLLIFAAAGTKLWYETERSDNNYVIAIDVSSSMAAKDILPTRLEAAKLYANNFIGQLDSKSKVGVVSFSGVTLIEQVLSEDKSLSEVAIDEIEVVSAGGTDVPGAVITSTNLLLSDPDKGRVIIMLTDGSSTLGNFIDNSLDKAVEYAQEQHVIIHTVGIGSESGPIGYLPEYYNISATYNLRTLNLLTNSTGGVLFESYTDEEVDESYADLIGEKDKAIVHIKLDYGLLILGILMLFIEWGLTNTRYRRIA